MKNLKIETRNKRHILFTEGELEDMLNGREVEVPIHDDLTVYCMVAEHFKQQNGNYTFDPSYIVRPDGSLHLREISIIPNPEKGDRNGDNK